jgi:RNA polymerase sigma factor (sigma-70 family)
MTPVRLLRATGDDALARRAARGDQDAFGVLFGRYQLRLELYCRSILRHDEDARDATQNAMTKAFLALRGREQDVAVRAWLFRIAHNESISLMRRRRPTAELGEDVPETVAAGAAPAEALELREELAHVLDGIRELPPRARQALLLRELADLDYAAVGQVLGITAGGARQAVFEARTALQADRAGRDAPCDSIRRELSEADHRRRPTRQVRGHLRGCDGCRTWSRAQDTRRERLSLVPGAGLAGGSLWGWVSGTLGFGAGAGAGGAASISGGGLALNAKVAASLAALAAGTAPVAVHEVERTLHPEDVATAAAPPSPTGTPAAADGVVPVPPATRSRVVAAAPARTSAVASGDPTDAATRAAARDDARRVSAAAPDAEGEADDGPRPSAVREEDDRTRSPRATEASHPTQSRPERPTSERRDRADGMTDGRPATDAAPPRSRREATARPSSGAPAANGQESSPVRESTVAAGPAAPGVEPAPAMQDDATAPAVQDGA